MKILVSGSFRTLYGEQNKKREGDDPWYTGVVLARKGVLMSEVKINFSSPYLFDRKFKVSTTQNVVRKKAVQDNGALRFFLLGILIAHDTDAILMTAENWKQAKSMQAPSWDGSNATGLSQVERSFDPTFVNELKKYLTI